MEARNRRRRVEFYCHFAKTFDYRRFDAWEEEPPRVPDAGYFSPDRVFFHDRENPNACGGLWCEPRKSNPLE